MREDAADAYISIDLDLLSRDYARTNWDQGETTLEDLLGRLDGIAHRYRIAGADICGGITKAQGGTPEDFAVNRSTRQALFEYFSRLD